MKTMCDVETIRLLWKETANGARVWKQARGRGNGACVATVTINIMTTCLFACVGVYMVCLCVNVADSD